MSTNVQAGVQPQLDPDGPPLPSQLYVPAAGGFAAPMGVAYAADGTNAGYALLAPAAPAAEFSQSHGAVVTFAAGGAAANLVLPAPGAGMTIVLLGLVASVGLTSAGTQVIQVASPSGMLGGAIFRLSSTTAQVGQFILPLATGVPFLTANASVTFAVAAAPATLVASAAVAAWYLIRPAN